MNDRTSSTLKKYAPTIVLLIIMVGITIWAFRSGMAVREDTPTISSLEVAVLLLVGLAAGVLGGIIGTGGCSVMLPVLSLWLGYPPTIAIGTTLFAVMFTAISGGYGHLVNKNVDTKTTLWLGGFGTIGVVIGSALFVALTSQAALFGLMLGLAFLLPAVRMTVEGFSRVKAPQREGNTVPGSRKAKAVFGSIVGIITGLVGLGGGYALVPGMIYLFGAPVYITMGTSLATMIPLAIIGGGLKLAGGYVALGAGLLLATGTIIGAQFGAVIIKRFRTNTLKLIFGVYFLYVSLKFIFGYFGINIW